MSKIQLSPMQQKVVNCWGKGQSVVAGAGSGKTTTLVLKCFELLNKNPDSRFAAVSFTEKSASDLKEKLCAKLDLNGKGGALSGHWVMTIHGLCAAIIKENAQIAGLDGEESVLSESEAKLLWEQAVDRLWFEQLPQSVEQNLQYLLDRESRVSLLGLLQRVKSLTTFGVLDALTESEGKDSKALLALSQYVLRHYENSKKRRGVLDFDDLERYAKVVMQDKKVQKRYQKHFDLVLVDEFQDTNPVQAEIIWKFVRPDQSNLCVVGDPKQSIYRFRDADVNVFQKLCDQLPEKQLLNWNFRSRPGIIDYTNQVCEKVFEPSEVEYQPLIPKREPDENLDPVLRLDLNNPEELGVWIKKQVQENSVPLHDMVVLLRRVRGNEKWLKALSASGIPIAVGSGGLFWEDPRVREITCFLRWWSNSQHVLSGASFLRAPWVGISDDTIDQWIKEDPQLKSLFLQSDHPIAQSLSQFKDDPYVDPGKLLLSLLVNDEIESEIGFALLGLWHRVEELSTKGLDFHSVVRELTLAMEESRRERDVPPPRNLGQLTVLTMHGSKGLEFPHVILVDLAGKTRAANAPLLFWDRNKGTYLAKRDENGDRVKKDDHEAQWRSYEKEKSLDEAKRLFYVALTRAQERLVFACLEQEKLADEKKVFYEDNWRGWIDCSKVEIPREKVDLSQDLTLNQSEQENNKTIKKISDVPLKRSRHSVTEWNMLARCLRCYEKNFLNVSGDDQNKPQMNSSELKSNMISFSEIGTRVHSCLENLDFENIFEIENEIGNKHFNAEAIVNWAQSSDWMKHSDLSQERKVWTELAFEYQVEGEVVVGSIDRLVYDSGNYTLIDFKITQRAKSPKSLLEAYENQMMLYAHAIEKIEPQSIGKLKAYLIHFSPKGATEVEVPLDNVLSRDKKIKQIALNAQSVLAGKKVKELKETVCRYCDSQKNNELFDSYEIFE